MVAAGTWLATELHQTPLHSSLAYHDAEASRRRRPRLLVKQPLSFLLFCLFFGKRKWGARRGGDLDSAALIPLSGLVIGVYVIGFYAVPINPCQSKVALASGDKKEKKKKKEERRRGKHPIIDCLGARSSAGV